MTTREDFEKWVKEGNEFSIGCDNFNEYLNHTTRMRWVGWQACDELNKAKLKEWQERAVDLEYLSMNRLHEIERLELENKTLREACTKALDYRVALYKNGCDCGAIHTCNPLKDELAKQLSEALATTKDKS